MELGIALPQFDFSVPGRTRLAWDTLAAWAERADALGFSSLWLADHLFLPLEKYGGSTVRNAGFEPLATLAALSRRTRQARLGTLVLCSPLRPARVLAKALTTLDHLSDGRLVAGVGAGWLEAEFAEAGVPFRGPGRRLDDLAADLVAMREVFESEALRPIPVQRPRPPLIVGGKGDRLIDVAVAHADGWNTVWEMTPADYRLRLEVVAAACERHGRDPGTLALSLGLNVLVLDKASDLAAAWKRLMASAPPGVLGGVSVEQWAAGRLVGTTQQIGERLAAFADLGVSEVVLNLGAVPFSVTGPDLDALDQLSTLLSGLMR